MNVFFASLGCDKNLVDSEMMLHLLADAQYQITEDETRAEIIIVNTCCFIHDAKQESIETILEMAELKKTAKLKMLIVTGCLAQRYEHEIREEIPEVDGLLDTTAYDEIVALINRINEGKGGTLLEDINRLPKGVTKRISTTGGYYAYLKIAEGCDKNCTYCIIPSLRGKFRSVAKEELIEQAKELAANGCKELNIIAQETTLYGVDLYGEKKLPELLKELSMIDGIEWIRLLYAYPEEITDELIDVMKNVPKICHYIDMPIQHASDDVLKRMGRKTNQQHIRKIVEKFRENIPDMCIRTTLITGFPGETNEDHEQLKDFVKEIKFDRLGVFTYSPEENTPAATIKGQLSERKKNKRRDELMEIQQKVTFEKNRAKVGLCLPVMVEGELPEEGVYVGRSAMDAPGIDGCVFFHAPYEIMSGTIVNIKIQEEKGYDLSGVLCEEEEA